MRILRLALPLVLATLLAPPLTAQGAPRCDGLRIGRISIERSKPPEIAPEIPDVVKPAVRLALVAATTHAASIRPFVLLDEGARCSELRRRETERVLRAQPYLADATVRAVPDGNGGVDIHITTVDEIARVIGGEWSNGQVSGIGVGSNNVGGQGIRAVAGWQEGFGFRDGYRGEVMLSHTFGEPHRFITVLERQPLDDHAQLVWERPFWSVVQNFGWYFGFDAANGQARFQRPDDLPLALPYESRRGDLGAVLRIGGESVGLFAGPFATHERFKPTGTPRRIGLHGFEDDTDPTLDGLYGAFESWRISGVLGGRWLNFRRAAGLDALAGSQDIGRGIQVALLTGIGLGGDYRHRYNGGEAFVGVGSDASYLAMRGFWEQRQSPDGESDVLASGRVRWYLKTAERSLVTVSGEFAGGWDKRRPFQLLLGDVDGGVRGFLGVPTAGAFRAVARVDHRRIVGDMGRAVLAWSVFGDVGGVDVGDSPYSAYSGVQASAGFALLASLPRESRRIWRLEVAYPMGSSAPADKQLTWRFGASSPLREFWRDPRDVARVRTVIPPASLFGFP